MHLVQRQPRESDPNSLYEKFRKQGAIEFTSLEGPLQADEWLAHTESVYETIECTGRQMVASAASMLRDIPDTWWRSVRISYRTIANEDAWATFERQFRKKFIPYHVTREKKAKFHSLKQ